MSIRSIHADTVGFASPTQVQRVPRLRVEVGEKCAGLLHNTRGQGLANIVAALDVGVSAFDWCTVASAVVRMPGATGNIVTEDLVFLLESMGLRAVSTSS